jgi:hypothetical protein
LRNAEFYRKHPLYSGSKAILRSYVANNAKRGTDGPEIERRVNALYDLLLDNTDTAAFNGSADLIAAGEALSYWQYAEKEFSHDGSEQHRMNLVFTLIPKKLYQELERTGSKERTKYLFSEFVLKDRWTGEDCCEDYFYSWYNTGEFSRNYCFFAKSYLNCFDYVMIYAYTEI